MICPVAPKVTLEIMPQVFDGVQLRTVSRKLYERHMIRNFELFARMETGSIPHHDPMLFSRDRLGKLLKEDIDDFGIQLRTEQSLGMPRLGADRTEHPQILVLGLPKGRGT